MPTPLTPEELDQIRTLNAQGLSLREVARRIGRSHAAVSQAAARMGLTWDRTAHTAAATAAAKADRTARRAAIIERLYARIEDILARLEASTYTFTATTVNGIETATLDEPPAHEVKALLQSVGSLVTAVTKLESVDDTGTEGSKSLLTGLVDGLRAVAAHLPGPDDDTPEPDDDVPDEPGEPPS